MDTTSKVWAELQNKLALILQQGELLEKEGTADQYTQLQSK